MTFGFDGFAITAEDVDAGAGADGAILEEVVVDDEVVEVFGRFEAEEGTDRALGVGIDDEDTAAAVGKKAGEGVNGGGFGDSTALVEDDEPGHRA
jgi:hypothetical protein